MSSEKEDILNAWIMTEHLAEGEFKKDMGISFYSKIKDGDHYQYFYDRLQGAKKERRSDSGKVPSLSLTIYFGVFPFKDVIDFLKEHYFYQEPGIEEEVSAESTTNKFSFALCFDESLMFQENKTFFTASYYIIHNGKIPDGKAYDSFEKDEKRKLTDILNCPEGKSYKEHFNEAFVNILDSYGIAPEDCYLSISGSNNEDPLFHSFFADDLRTARKNYINNNANLDAYLSGVVSERIDLDSRKESPKFNPLAFWKILQPKNYPLARFPSEPYPLSFMQQVAVNLAIKDNAGIKSVNGPPGTGKTTLLKDIFAELVVEQAVEMVTRRAGAIKGNVSENGQSVGKLVEEIAGKGIVVASTNNAAVQNIVVELPKLSGIAKEFQEELIEAGYFHKSADTKNWGLFSLEGGSKDNRTGILDAIKAALDEDLNKAYKSDETVYRDFLALYEEILAYRAERQHAADLLKKEYELEMQTHDEEALLDNLRCRAEEKRQQRKDLDEALQCCKQEINTIARSETLIRQKQEALNHRKPGLITRLFMPEKTREYTQKRDEYSRQLCEALEKREVCEKKEADLTGQIKTCEKAIAEILQRQDVAQAQYQQTMQELDAIKENLESCKTQSDLTVLELSSYDDYAALQKSNPWFDETYRKKQSRLFIAALKVRKQFLYENQKNIKSAHSIWDTIWNKKNCPKYTPEMASAAWDWINLVIPVISTTFASFGQMFKLLKENTLGYLFVDEAGQAVPQAAVGAIFRSKKVMVVGDPKQIQPVITLESGVLGMLGQHFSVDISRYLSDTASVQTLVDAASLYGFYEDKAKTQWIGIPLWVHRRCKDPMFSISNSISYDGNMVQGKESADGKAIWYDKGGYANDKYVQEQGMFLKGKIQDLLNEDPGNRDKIYVITPFRNVAYRLAKVLEQIHFTKRDDNGKATNVGTVHTFQGKEANIVFLVLGADQSSEPAASWAVSTPNILNVAATRAKEEFYIIGDRKLYESFKFNVIQTVLAKVPLPEESQAMHL